MAALVTRRLFGDKVDTDSCGVYSGRQDFFVASVLNEWGLTMETHRAKLFAEMQVDRFDYVIALSARSYSHARALTQGAKAHFLYWELPNPSWIEGSRQTKLEAYRALRDELASCIEKQFSPLLKA